MPEEKTTAASKTATKAPAGPQKYENKGTANCHTENGRCMPGETIELTAEQAKQYPGLELCQ